MIKKTLIIIGILLAVAGLVYVVGMIQIFPFERSGYFRTFLNGLMNLTMLVFVVKGVYIVYQVAKKSLIKK